MNTSRKKLILGFLCFVMVFAIVMSSGRKVYATEYFVGEIIVVAFDFCPTGFAEANGQLLPISQNEALYSLLGTTYGGDGITTFALPDLRGRTPVHISDDIVRGQKGGAEQVTLTVDQLPSHSHSATTNVNVTATLKGTSNASTSTTPTGNVLATQKSSNKIYSGGSANTNMGSSSISTETNATTVVAANGGGQPIDIRSPYMGLIHCIALQGIYPAQQ